MGNDTWSPAPDHYFAGGIRRTRDTFVSFRTRVLKQAAKNGWTAGLGSRHFQRFSHEDGTKLTVHYEEQRGLFSDAVLFPWGDNGPGVRVDYPELQKILSKGLRCKCSEVIPDVGVKPDPTCALRHETERVNAECFERYYGTEAASG